MTPPSGIWPVVVRATAADQRRSAAGRPGCAARRASQDRDEHDDARDQAVAVLDQLMAGARRHDAPVAERPVGAAEARGGQPHHRRRSGRSPTAARARRGSGARRRRACAGGRSEGMRGHRSARAAPAPRGVKMPPMALPDDPGSPPVERREPRRHGRGRRRHAGRDRGRRSPSASPGRTTPGGSCSRSSRCTTRAPTAPRPSPIPDPGLARRLRRLRRPGPLGRPRARARTASRAARPSTVFWDRAGRRVAYTVGLGRPGGRAPATRGAPAGAACCCGASTSAGRTAVTWDENGHTAVISAIGISRAALYNLAGGRGCGR